MLNIKFDGHIHYYGDDVSKLKRIVSNSQYASKYMCYQSVNYEQIEAEKYISNDIVYFMIPFVLKETDICMANERLANFANVHDNIISFPLLGDDMENYERFIYLGGFKEHFLLHSEDKYDERCKYYDYLNQRKKVMLLHCKDDIRYEYIKRLRRQFPNMYIQVAHMGVCRKDIQATRKFLIEFEQDDHIYYDVSTVYDFDFLRDVFDVVKSQIIYGSDFPYVSREQSELQKKFLNEHPKVLQLMENNAERLLRDVIRK